MSCFKKGRREKKSIYPFASALQHPAAGQMCSAMNRLLREQGGPACLDGPAGHG